MKTTILMFMCMIAFSALSCSNNQANKEDQKTQVNTDTAKVDTTLVDTLVVE